MYRESPRGRTSKSDWKQIATLDRSCEVGKNTQLAMEMSAEGMAQIRGR